MAATLVLGPLLRYVGSETATVWVETDGPAEVEVLGRRAQIAQAAISLYYSPPNNRSPNRENKKCRKRSCSS